MIDKTRGILLHQVKYSENSIIATIYTEAFGRQSYIVSGVHGRKSGVKSSVFHPLFLLDLEVYHKPGRNLNRIKTARIAVPYSSLPFDIRKSSLAIFLAEILYKCLREEEPDSGLFEFLFHSFSFLDLTEKGTANFHLWFLLKMTTFLGIFPNRENLEISNYFDLQKARFTSSEPIHPQYMNKHITSLFAQLFDLGFSNLHEFNLTGSERQELLQKLIDFYQIHFEMIGELKSLRVLKEVFN